MRFVNEYPDGVSRSDDVPYGESWRLWYNSAQKHLAVEIAAGVA